MRIWLAAVLVLLVALAAGSARGNHPIEDGGTMCARETGTGIGGWHAWLPFTNTHYSMWNTSPTNPLTAYTAQREAPGPITTYAYEKIGGGYHEFFNSVDAYRRSRLNCCDGGYQTNWVMEQYAQGSC